MSGKRIRRKPCNSILERNLPLELQLAADPHGEFPVDQLDLDVKRVADLVRECDFEPVRVGDLKAPGDLLNDEIAGK